MDDIVERASLKDCECCGQPHRFEWSDAYVQSLKADNAALRMHLEIALDTLRSEGCCDKHCTSCSSARALLERKKPCD